MPRLTTLAKQALTEDRRRQILDAAVRVFARKGYATATVADIAGSAHVAEGTIYNYFRNKEDLLIHIPRYLAGPVFEHLTSRLAQVRTPEDAERELVTLGAGMVAQVSTHLSFVKVFLSALPHLSTRARMAYLRLLPLAVAGALEEHMRQGIASGLYRADLEPAVAARALPEMLFMSVVLQEVVMGGRAPRQRYDAIVRENVRLFLHGALDHPTAVQRPARKTG